MTHTKEYFKERTAAVSLTAEVVFIEIQVHQGRQPSKLLRDGA